MKINLLVLLLSLAAQASLAAVCKISTSAGTAIGSVKESGTIVTTVSGKEKVVGSVDKGDNILSSFFTNKIGRIGLDGSILDYNEEVAGTLDENDGSILVNNKAVGKVSGCDLGDTQSLSRAKAGAYIFLMLKVSYSVSSVGWSDQPDIAENNFQRAVERACPGFPSYEVSNREVIYNSRHAFGNPRAYSLQQKAEVQCFHYVK